MKFIYKFVGEPQNDIMVVKVKEPFEITKYVQLIRLPKPWYTPPGY